MTIVADVIVHELSLNSFRAGIRSAVRGLWTGDLDFFQSFETMMLAIERGLTQAWNEGAKEMGILPGERTVEEEGALQTAITKNISYLDKFLTFVEAHSKANDGKLGTNYTRVEVWVNRYNDVRNLARVMSGEDTKVRWDYGPTKEHCRSCSSVVGKVKRKSVWIASGFRPQSPRLECKGYKCQCQWTPTSEPATRGVLPRL